MKITVFTSNKSRHNYLINQISLVASKLFVIQECDTLFSGELSGNYPKSNILKKYFDKVNKSQKKVFGNQFIDVDKKINLLSLKKGDLNNCKLIFLDKFLKSDLYIVFGSSYIKGNLAKFLSKKRTYNIHMGISPYYRGADCNFWALYDNNYHLVGSTIHRLTEGLDNGPILYHAICENNLNFFDYSMLSVKAAIISLKENIKNGKILKIKEKKVNPNKLIRYSKTKDFNNKIIINYFKKKIKRKNKDYDLLKDPFILKKEKFFK